GRRHTPDQFCRLPPPYGHGDASRAAAHLVTRRPSLQRSAGGQVRGRICFLQVLTGTRVTASTAWRITAVTASGCEIMITCEPSTSVIFAPARSAIERVTSAPAALSPVATTAHDGRCFHAGGPDASENASSLKGRWVAAIRAACSSDRSLANA